MPSSKTAESLADLKALSGIIQDSIATIESSLSEKDMEFPSASTPMTRESEAPRMVPAVDEACTLIVSAAYQLIFTARSPMLSMISMSMQFNLSAALGLACSANTVEACREAGPQGAHVKDIASARGVDPAKLARALRLLATHHVFVEVAPNVFANNRCSSTLDTGKAVKELQADPKSKHIGTRGFAAAVEHSLDTTFKTCSYLQDAVLDTKITFSQEPTETARNIAFHTTLDPFEWLKLPENEYRLGRFSVAMAGVRAAAPPTAVVEGFDWAGMKKDALVVDVGGGIGSQAMTLSQKFSHLRFIVQDREEVIGQAVQYWNTENPEAVQSGRVRLEVNDFFKGQPVKNADVFFMRNIMHDWSDKYCVTILRHLREAAAPSTQLVIFDSLIPHACPESELSDIAGSKRVVPPKPLLPNRGHGGGVSYFQDLIMMATLNGQERTMTEMRSLLEKTGWKLVAVHLGASAAFSVDKAIAVPM